MREYCQKHLDRYQNYDECHEEVMEERREREAQRHAAADDAGETPARLGTEMPLSPEPISERTSPK